LFLRNAHQTVIEEYDRLNATRGANRARKMVRDLIQESGLDTFPPPPLVLSGHAASLNPY